MLVTSAYTPDQDAHDKRDDVIDEVSGTGYCAGGATLPNKSVAAENTDNEGSSTPGAPYSASPGAGRPRRTG